MLRLGKKWLVFDRKLLKRTISYGWASAMQQATVQLGKLGNTGYCKYHGRIGGSCFCSRKPDR